MTTRYVSALLTIGFIMTSQCASECIRSCRCDPNRNIVYCNDRELNFVPYGIPTSTKTLHLQNNDVINGPLTDANLAGLADLEMLDMHHNKLSSIPTGLPNSLYEISMRSNSIKYIGRTALQGLNQLTELHLDDNNITNQGLSSAAFQDTNNLKVLVLTNNLLTSIPEGLPASLMRLILDRNHIQFVTITALKHMVNLKALDLSNNVIEQRYIEPHSLFSLIALQSLDISGNQLTEIPSNLPEDISQLHLSRNRIEYIFASQTEARGTLKNLRKLSKLDLSFNLLKSVEENSFSDLELLRTVELQDNPWTCDCYLVYLKWWLLTTNTILSSESNIRCSDPKVFHGVMLNNIDLEAFTCDRTANIHNVIQIKDTTTSQLQVSYQNVQTVPPFIETYLLYGKLTCDNCTFAKTAGLTQINGEALSYIENYSLVDFTSDGEKAPNKTILVDNLNPSTHYAICLLRSDQNADQVPSDLCIDAWTSDVIIATNSPVKDENDEAFPIWIIALCSAIMILTIALIIVGIALRRKTLKKRGNKMYSSNNRNDFYIPEALLPARSRYPATTSAGREFYGTSASDRTYMECGSACPSTTHRSVRTVGDAAVDARREFTLMYKPDNSATVPKLLLRSGNNSSCSECRGDTTISTNQTSASAGTMETRYSPHSLPPVPASPPPLYEQSHCPHNNEHYDELMLTSRQCNTDHLRQDTGSYV